MSGAEPAAAAPAPSAPVVPLVQLGAAAAVCDGDTCTF
ncbi:hypothetical protein J2Y42_002663 [Leifsonia sp. 1010]|nr:hypothetical protein [Leifsonia sp. 1010]